MISDLQLILVGAIIGLLVAAPVGPVNVLCIQRTLERGFWGGLSAGLGAVIGDGLIALVAALGISAITEAIDSNRTLIKLVGGMILLAFGLKLFFTYPASGSAGSARTGRLPSRFSAFGGSIPQTFFLTITNPGAVLGMFGIVGSVGTAIGGFASAGDAGLFVLAVMGGSLIWWTGLASLISRLHHRLTPARLRQINQIAGVVLIAFGVALMGETAVGAFVEKAAAAIIPVLMAR